MIDDATLFKIMQAIERAKQYAGYDKDNGTVRVDSRDPRQMNLADSLIFKEGLIQLEESGKIKIKNMRWLLITKKCLNFMKIIPL